MSQLISDFLYAKRLGAPGTGSKSSPNTLRSYKRALERAEGVVGKPLETFTRDDVAHLIDESTDEYSPATINQMLSAMRVFFEWLHIEGIVAQDPTFGFRQVQKLRALPVTLTRDEIHAILTEIPEIAEERRAAQMQKSWRNQEPPDVGEKYELMLWLMAVGGMRVSEVASLHAGDITFDGVIVTGKGDKERFVPIRDDILDWLRKYAQGLEEDEFIFQGEQGMPKLANTPMNLQTLYSYFNEAVERSGIVKRGPITPHTLRHSFATQALQQTGRLEIVQDLLGHANPQTTRIYAQVGQDDLKREYKKIWAS